MVVKTLNSQKEIEEVLFNPTKDCILLVDQNGIIQYSNSIIETMFGYSRQTIYNQKIALLFPIKFFSLINTHIYRCSNRIDSTINNIIEKISGRKKDGTVFFINISLQYYEYQKNKMVLIRIVDKTFLNNISENEKKLKEYLLIEKNNKKLQSQFVSKTSHELRTPLTTILNATTILDKFKGSFGFEDVQKKNINRIKSSINQLTQVLDDFLTINKIEEYSVSKTNINITKFIQDILDNLQDSANKNNLLINYTHSGDLQTVIDSNMLNSIINNLLSNAIKYTKNEKDINFSTELYNNQLIIICKDQGIGIPKSQQDKLFNRYFRANNTLNINGTGLGLSIIKEHLNKIGGKIYFKSKLGFGSTFTIKIPLNTVTSN